MFKKITALNSIILFTAFNGLTASFSEGIINIYSGEIQIESFASSKITVRNLSERINKIKV